MRRHPHETRQRLSEILTKRMIWTPREGADGRYYEFTAECSFGGLVKGILTEHPKRWWPQRDSNPCSSHAALSPA